MANDKSIYEFGKFSIEFHETFYEFSNSLFHCFSLFFFFDNRFVRRSWWKLLWIWRLYSVISIILFLQHKHWHSRSVRSCFVSSRLGVKLFILCRFLRLYCQIQKSEIISGYFKLTIQTHLLSFSHVFFRSGGVSGVVDQENKNFSIDLAYLRIRSSA